jgi:ferredoxin
VDPEKCQGHNRCYSISPELFDLDDLGMSSEIGTGAVPAELAGKARLAVANPSGGTGDEQAAAVPEAIAGQIPHLVAMLAEVAHDDPDSTLGWCDDQTEFEFGLDLILDGLDTMRLSPRRSA